MLLLILRAITARCVFARCWDSRWLITSTDPTGSAVATFWVLLVEVDQFLSILRWGCTQAIYNCRSGRNISLPRFLLSRTLHIRCKWNLVGTQHLWNESKFLKVFIHVLLNLLADGSFDLWAVFEISIRIQLVILEGGGGKGIENLRSFLLSECTTCPSPGPPSCTCGARSVCPSCLGPLLFKGILGHLRCHIIYGYWRNTSRRPFPGHESSTCHPFWVLDFPAIGDYLDFIWYLTLHLSWQVELILEANVHVIVWIKTRTGYFVKVLYDFPPALSPGLPALWLPSCHRPWWRLMLFTVHYFDWLGCYPFRVKNYLVHVPL